VEHGEEGQVGLGPLLVGAEGIAEVDQLQAQGVWLKVAWHDPLRDLPRALRTP